MVKVNLPAILRTLVAGERSVDAIGPTVGDVFADLGKRYPKLGAQLTSPDGGLPAFVNVFLDDEDIRYLKGLESPVGDHSEITLLPAVAGG